MPSKCQLKHVCPCMSTSILTYIYYVNICIQYIHSYWYNECYFKTFVVMRCVYEDRFIFSVRYSGKTLKVENLVSLVSMVCGWFEANLLWHGIKKMNGCHFGTSSSTFIIYNMLCVQKYAEIWLVCSCC